MVKVIAVLLTVLASTPNSHATWEKGEVIPEGGRPNPLEWESQEWPRAVARGRLHALVYPVEITGALLPYRPIERFLEDPFSNPLKEFMRQFSTAFARINSFTEAMDWLGLHRYPPDSGSPGSPIPLPPGMRAGESMGLSRITAGEAVGFTFSCAACHVGQLFGRPIIGLTNRFPRANVLSIRGKSLTSLVPSRVFGWTTEASRAERELYRRTRHNMQFVNGRRPQTLGLDTSLAHVALSLAHRARDPDATKDLDRAYQPDDEPLARTPADSKPAVWWNLKYKNRWLSDGSVVSGNPIVTNILWNEIGRGTDLVELRQWLTANQTRVNDLATAVFATEAPRITDFFAAEKLDLAAAKRGETHFARYCARCHGHYEKGWAADSTSPLADQLKTTKVIYVARTRVIDVGTDAHRYLGMASLLRLNDLAISERFGVQVELQTGYVPPPLVGIWARWPYLHNNSVPSLCAILTRASARPRTYWAGEPRDPETDFDFTCNGYPAPEAVPMEWTQTPEREYNTAKRGLGNSGHDEGIFLKDGQELMSNAEKIDLVRYLQTL